MKNVAFLCVFEVWLYSEKDYKGKVKQLNVIVIWARFYIKNFFSILHIGQKCLKHECIYCNAF